MPLIEKTVDPSRVVFVSSAGAANGVKYDWEAMKTTDTSTLKMQAYFNSKLANAIYARKLSQLYGKQGHVTAYSVHPGVVATDIWKALPRFVQRFAKLFMLSEDQGAFTQLYCATMPGIENLSGMYFDNCKSANINVLVDDQNYVDELYEKSLLFVKEHLVSTSV